MKIQQSKVEESQEKQWKCGPRELGNHSAISVIRKQDFGAGCDFLSNLHIPGSNFLLNMALMSRFRACFKDDNRP